MRWQLLAIVLVLAALGGCKQNEGKNCQLEPAGNLLHFRLVDTAGKDLLVPAPGRLSTSSFHITQPCNSDSLIPHFIPYLIPNTNDSGVVFNFEHLRTPEYGEGGPCMRFFFNWGGDIDTLDWHYKLEEKDGCFIEVIDYMCYNGNVTTERRDNAHVYYPLVKSYP